LGGIGKNGEVRGIEIIGCGKNRQVNRVSGQIDNLGPGCINRGYKKNDNCYIPAPQNSPYQE
jgi:hypothetical protein